MIQPLLFYALAALIIICALLVVSVKNIFHAGLFLIGAFLGVAGIYVTLQNFFLAAAQALIYSGAIAVLILFGIMMTQRRIKVAEPSHNPFKIVSALMCVALLALMTVAYGKLPYAPISPAPDLLHDIGTALMQTYVLPFEIISVLLLAALIGALAVAGEGEEA